MKRLWIAVALVVGLAAGVASQDGSGPIGNLMGRTDENGYLLVTSGGVGASQTPLTPIANLRGKTDSNGYLMVGLTGGVFPTGAALKTGTTANDTLLLQAYDVDGAAYTTLLTLTAGNTPSMTGLFGTGSAAAPGVAVGSANNGLYEVTSAILGVSVGGTRALSIYQSRLAIGASADVIIGNEAAAVLQLGQDVNGSAVPQTLKAHDGITGTDIAGANLILAGGRGTGAGAPGSLIFQTATALGSGTTAQTLATRLIIGPTGAATFGTTAGTGTGAVYADTFYTGTTVGCSGTPTVATKGIATTCTEPVPEPLTQSEVNELRGLLAMMRGKA